MNADAAVLQPLAALDLSSHNHLDSHVLDLDSLRSLHLLPVLELDDRPTLILDLWTAENDQSKALQPIYTNPALLASGELLSLVTGNVQVSSTNPTPLRPYSRFRQWLLKKKHQSNASSRGNAYMFEGFFWSATNIDDRWKIISGLQSFLSPVKSSGISAHDNAKPDHTKPRAVARNSSDQSDRDEKLEGVLGGPQMPSRALYTIDQLSQANSKEHPPRLKERSSSTEEISPKIGPFDCTLDGSFGPTSPHIDFFREFNWSETSLGPMNQWPEHLRTIVNVVMKDTNPAVIFWGDDVVLIYNEAYIEVLGVLHPMAFGKSARLAVSE
ncbi:hypothetical protein BU16DRAFT_16632 [Lophium mytilinum]|uniref:PAS-like domain-containing protein n=1 Tax=Lophium mytilinum TaxID=390894 RepID=A0A6A6RDA0_9PEZI|nr:hypothetical protein BU16DRAFT_16632 [Lophium mytilinum]